MPVFSASEMPFSKMRAIKKKALQYGLQKVKQYDPSTKWIAREVFPGDDDATDFNDLEWATAQSSTDFVGWIQDASDLTADDLSSVFVNGETLDEDQMIVWYGTFDLSPQLGELTRSNDGESPGRGPLTGIRFTRGSSDLEYWGTEHLYTNKNVVGFSDRVVQYLEEQPIDIQMNFSEATEDKYIGLRGYLFEKAGKHVSPVEWSGGRFMQPEPWQWGVDPVQELTTEEIWNKKQMAAHNLKQKLMSMGVAQNPEDIVVREAVFGDETNATDFVDFDYNTASTTGQQSQVIDAGDLTQDQFSSVLATGESVDDNKAIAVLGFWDKDPNPSLMRLRFDDGSSTRAVYEVEHCYGYRDEYVEGYFSRPVYYEEREQFDPQFAFHDAGVDHNTGLYTLIAERWGETVSKE